MSVMKKLGGIVPRCLRKIMKRTIPILRSLFDEKLTTILQVAKMAWDCRSMSRQGGFFWSRPPRGLGGFSVVGGRSHGEERRKASPCFLQLAVRGPYVVRTYGQKKGMHDHT